MQIVYCRLHFSANHLMHSGDDAGAIELEMLDELARFAGFAEAIMDADKFLWGRAIAGQDFRHG